jgi:hypothetical protein
VKIWGEGEREVVKGDGKKDILCEKSVRICHFR